ncbi:MAG: universal stress protein [Symploca sp. SIO2E9]|nr:universal stress protein [Symploca sp. SIO2E9]
MFNTVLLPVDQSREAREAAEVVLHIVKKYDSRLILLSVIPESDSESESAPPETMMSSERVAELLKNAKALFAQNEIKAETISRQGQPPFVICDVAEEVDADLIVMGCRGLGLTEEGAAESVTNRVINLSPCPVLVVP